MRNLVTGRAGDASVDANFFNRRSSSSSGS